MKILAVIVTYNRRELLHRCLERLAAQKRPADAIVVVNNGSTDGTAELLERLGTPFITQENVGSAGGWHTGIQYALEKGFDAVWLMDDDGFPDAGALSALHGHLLDGVSCASSIVVREDEPTRFVFPFPVLSDSGFPVIFGVPRTIAKVADLKLSAVNGSYPFAHFFNGALISLSAVRSVGNVDREYFIYGDEVDYFFRLRRAGRIISIVDALHYHPDVSQRPFTTIKVYYYLKNTLIVNSRYFNHAWLRNVIAIAVVWARTAKRNGLGMGFSLLVGKSAPAFYKAIYRGLSGKLGKDFNG